MKFAPHFFIAAGKFAPGFKSRPAPTMAVGHLFAKLCLYGTVFQEYGACLRSAENTSDVGCCSGISSRHFSCMCKVFSCGLDAFSAEQTLSEMLVLTR